MNVLVLGAGINGAAIARELLLNGVSVTVVDSADIAGGATAYSSRLIHGGLRYLEYGEFDLVRESLAERTRLLRLAPQFVRPLRLFVPIVKGRRLAGWSAAIRRFLGGSAGGDQPPVRGLWLVRAGLWLYDRYARDRALPRHAIHRLGTAGTPPVDPARYGWLGSYFDAQILFPERFVLSMLADARQLAAEQDLAFRVWTYHRATLSPDGEVEVRRLADGATVGRMRADAIVNATGAWIDQTLQTLQAPERRLIGGTKGSHFLTSHQGLREALNGAGVYAEAADGRPVFILPFDQYSLVGTTDLPFAGDPSTAIADDDELDYLRKAVTTVFPSITLSPADIVMHYSGVRPLPFVDAALVKPGAITRRHRVVETAAATPIFSAIGGKLTTCRSFAEEITAQVLQRLGLPMRGTSRERVFPGGELYPRDSEALAAELVRGTQFPRSSVRRVLRDEWVTHLHDLVERRLMLQYDPSLGAGTLRELAALMAEEQLISPDRTDDEVALCVARLEHRHGKRLSPES